MVSAFQEWMIAKDDATEAHLWDARFLCSPSLLPTQEDDNV